MWFDQAHTNEPNRLPRCDTGIETCTLSTSILAAANNTPPVDWCSLHTMPLQQARDTYNVKPIIPKSSIPKAKAPTHATTYIWVSLGTAWSAMSCGRPHCTQQHKRALTLCQALQR